MAVATDNKENVFLLQIEFYTPQWTVLRDCQMSSTELDAVLRNYVPFSFKHVYETIQKRREFWTHIEGVVQDFLELLVAMNYVEINMLTQSWLQFKQKAHFLRIFKC